MLSNLLVSVHHVRHACTVYRDPIRGSLLQVTPSPKDRVCMKVCTSHSISLSGLQLFTSHEIEYNIYTKEVKNIMLTLTKECPL